MVNGKEGQFMRVLTATALATFALAASQAHAVTGIGIDTPKDNWQYTIEVKIKPDMKNLWQPGRLVFNYNNYYAYWDTTGRYGDEGYYWVNGNNWTQEAECYQGTCNRYSGYKSTSVRHEFEFTPKYERFDWFDDYGNEHNDMVLGSFKLTYSKHVIGNEVMGCGNPPPDYWRGAPCWVSPVEAVFILGSNGNGAIPRSEFEYEIVSFSERSLLTTAVPEPATWAMMIFGFGVIGSAMRRRRMAVSYG